MKLIKYLLLFLLIYLDPVSIGFLKWAQIWKIIILILFFLTIKKTKQNKFSTLYFLLAISSLINVFVFNNFINEFAIFIKNLLLPCSIIFLINKNTLNLNNLIRNFSVFIILSGIPFSLNLIPQLGFEYNLTIFGASEDINSFTGLFQTPHGASIITAYATVVCFTIFNNSRKKSEKYFMLIICILGIYLSFKTYVRTGLVMVLVGILSGSLYGKSTTSFLKFIPLILVFMYFTFLYISSNETLNNRLIGINKYQDSSDLNTISSGRLEIWASSLASFTRNNNPIEIIFGLGENELKVRNKENIGRQYVTHNGFLDILITNGILGFIIFSIFLKKWYIYLRYKMKILNINNIDLRLSISFFFMYISFMLVQGGPLVYDSIYIAYSIILVSKSTTNNEKFNNTF